MWVSSTRKNVLSGGSAKPAFAAIDCGGPRDGVGGAAALLVPVGSLRAAAFSSALTRYPPSCCSCCEQRVVDRRIDDEIAVGRTARSVVVGLADRGVARGFDDVGGLVDHHRRVAGADAVGRLARAVGGLDHRRAAGRDRQIADRHQLVRERNARLLDALQHVFGNAELLQRRAHQRTVSLVVFLLDGCGEKITASLHLIA